MTRSRRSRWPARQARRTPGRPRDPVPARSCAGRRRPPGWARREGRGGPGQPRRTGHRLRTSDRAAASRRVAAGRRSRDRPDAAHARATVMNTRPTARQTAATSGRRELDPARTRIASSGSRVVSTSGRPRPGPVIRGGRRRRGVGTPSDDRVLDRRDLLDRAGGRASSGTVPPAPGRGASPAVPMRFAGHDDEPVVERVGVDARSRRGPRGRRTGRPPGRSSIAAPAPARAALRGVVRRRTSGRWASSSNSSSAVDAAVDPDVAGRVRPASREASAT